MVCSFLVIREHQWHGMHDSKGDMIGDKTKMQEKEGGEEMGETLSITSHRIQISSPPSKILIKCFSDFEDALDM